jgi:glycosyltransferase involved in cell wall biosynthesis
MSTIAHLGHGLARQGGPSGYLAQLDRAFRAHGTGAHDVLLPAPVAAAATPVAKTRTGGTLAFARRLRRTLIGEPRYNRHLPEECRRPGGPLSTFLRDAWSGVQEQVAPSVERARDARADVLFAHDAPSAESALDRRVRGQEVWVLLHTPMPLALYLAWCWGVPDRSWTEVAEYPDVIEWMAREADVVRRADRIIVPCAEAAAEISRGYEEFRAVLARAEYLLTGGEGPPRRRQAHDRPSLRASFGLPAHEPVGLFLGNPQPYRGLDVALEALRLLPSRRELPGVLAVAGCAPDRLAFYPRLRPLGFVGDVSDLLAAVDFIVNTNRFSLFDLSLIEAVEAGKPLLLHATGGNRVFANLGAGCRTVETLEPAAIAEAMAGLFANAATLQQLAARSRSCWERTLTPRHLRDRHVALYDDFACGTAARPA